MTWIISVYNIMRAVSIYDEDSTIQLCIVIHAIQYYALLSTLHNTMHAISIYDEDSTIQWVLLCGQQP